MNVSNCIAYPSIRGVSLSNRCTKRYNLMSSAVTAFSTSRTISGSSVTVFSMLAIGLSVMVNSSSLLEESTLSSPNTTVSSINSKGGTWDKFICNNNTNNINIFKNTFHYVIVISLTASQRWNRESWFFPLLNITKLYFFLVYLNSPFFTAGEPEKCAPSSAKMIVNEQLTITAICFDQKTFDMLIRRKNFAFEWWIINQNFSLKYHQSNYLIKLKC